MQGRGLHCREPILRGTALIWEPAIVAPSREALSAVVAADWATFSNLAHDSPSGDAAAARSVVAMNGFRWGGGGDEWALLPRTAMLNHSCAPNACVITCAHGAGAIPAAAAGAAAAPRALVLAARDIAVGEEVHLCYSSSVLLSDVTSRRGALREGWGFLCECDRCVAEVSGGSGGGQWAQWALLRAAETAVRENTPRGRECCCKELRAALERAIAAALELFPVHTHTLELLIEWLYHVDDGDALPAAGAPPSVLECFAAHGVPEARRALDAWRVRAQPHVV